MFKSPVAGRTTSCRKNSSRNDSGRHTSARHGNELAHDTTSQRTIRHGVRKQLRLHRSSTNARHSTTREQSRRTQDTLTRKALAMPPQSRRSSSSSGGGSTNRRLSANGIACAHAENRIVRGRMLYSRAAKHRATKCASRTMAATRGLNEAAQQRATPNASRARGAPQQRRKRTQPARPVAEGPHRLPAGRDNGSRTNNNATRRYGQK